MANPMLTQKRITKLTTTREAGPRMSRDGVVRALGELAVLALVAAMFGWTQVSGQSARAWAFGLMDIAILGGLVLGIIISFRPRRARTLGPIYALLEGYAVGLISAVYNARYPGIVLDALGVTTAVALAVWFLYGTGIVKVTAKLRRIITMAVIGAMGFYLLSIVSSLFGGGGLTNMGGAIGIGISVVLSLIAAATFLTDFDRIDRLIAANADADLDWYGAFSLLVSFIWLYLEILRLLGKLNRR